MKAYLFLVKIRLERALEYKFDVFYTILFQGFVMMTTALFWNALFKGKEIVGGVNNEDMLTYTIISAAMSCILFVDVEQKIIQSVRKGTIATDMLKPVNVFGLYFAEDIGDMITGLFQKVIPIIVIASIFIQIPKPHSLMSLLLFFISLLMGYLINWIIAAIFGTIAFAAVEIGPLVQIKKHIIRLLSGSMIPLWFFPDWLEKVLKLLPFPYIYQLPLSLYIGKAAGNEIVEMFMIQTSWLCVLIVLFVIVNKNVSKHVMVQGG